MLQNILEKLATADKPITSVIKTTNSSKVVAVGLNTSIKLRDHRAPGKTQLLVIKGSISYKTNEKELVLNQYESYDIPLDETHNVTGLEPSIFLLMVG